MFVMVFVLFLKVIKYQIYCTQIKYIYLAATALHSWAAVQRHLSAKLLQVSNFKSHSNLGSPKIHVDQGHTKIFPQLMVHVCHGVKLQIT